MRPSQRHEIPSFKPFSFCALCPAALWPLCVPCKVNKVSLWFHILLNVESFQVQVDGSRGWKLLEDSWLDTRAEGRIGETEATMKQYSWERTWIWTRSSVDYHQVSSEVSWRTPVWKPHLERRIIRKVTKVCGRVEKDHGWEEVLGVSWTFSSN